MLVHTHTAPHMYKQTYIYIQTRNTTFLKSPEDSVDDGHVAIPLWLHAREATKARRPASHHNSYIRTHRPDASTGAHADEGERSLEYLIPTTLSPPPKQAPSRKHCQRRIWGRRSWRKSLLRSEVWTHHQRLHPQIHRSTRKSHIPKGNSSPQRQKTPPPEQTTKTTTAAAALQTSTILTSYLEPIRSYIHRTTRKIRFPYPSGAGKATGGEGEPASSTPERFAALIASLFTVAPGKNEKGVVVSAPRVLFVYKRIGIYIFGVLTYTIK